MKSKQGLACGAVSKNPPAIAVVCPVTEKTLEHVGFSSCGSGAPECGLRNHDTWAWLLCGPWNHSEARSKPMSPALAGGFLLTAPQASPCLLFILS